MFHRIFGTFVEEDKVLESRARDPGGYLTMCNGGLVNERNARKALRDLLAYPLDFWKELLNKKSPKGNFGSIFLDMFGPNPSEESTRYNIYVGEKDIQLPSEGRPTRWSKFREFRDNWDNAPNGNMRCEVSLQEYYLLKFLSFSPKFLKGKNSGSCLIYSQLAADYMLYFFTVEHTDVVDHTDINDNNKHFTDFLQMISDFWLRDHTCLNDAGYYDSYAYGNLDFEINAWSSQFRFMDEAVSYTEPENIHIAALSGVLSVLQKEWCKVNIEMTDELFDFYRDLFDYFSGVCLMPVPHDKFFGVMDVWIHFISPWGWTRALPSPSSKEFIEIWGPYIDKFWCFYTILFELFVYKFNILLKNAQPQNIPTFKKKLEIVLRIYCRTLRRRLAYPGSVNFNEGFLDFDIFGASCILASIRKKQNQASANKNLNEVSICKSLVPYINRNPRKECFDIIGGSVKDVLRKSEGPDYEFEDEYWHAGMDVASAIMLKTHKGKIVKLDARIDFLVEKVKVEIQDVEGIPAAEQCLIFKGKELKNDQKLSFYKVELGSTLYVAPKSLDAGQAVASIKLLSAEEDVIKHHPSVMDILEIYMYFDSLVQKNTAPSSIGTLFGLFAAASKSKKPSILCELDKVWNGIGNLASQCNLAAASIGDLNNTDRCQLMGLTSFYSGNYQPGSLEGEMKARENLFSTKEKLSYVGCDYLRPVEDHEWPFLVRISIWLSRKLDKWKRIQGLLDAIYVRRIGHAYTGKSKMREEFGLTDDVHQFHNDFVKQKTSKLKELRLNLRFVADQRNINAFGLLFILCWLVVGGCGMGWFTGFTLATIVFFVILFLIATLWYYWPMIRKKSHFLIKCC